MNKGIHYSTLTKIVIVLCAVSLILAINNTIQFYSTLGHSQLGKISYIITGILLTVLTVTTGALTPYMFKIGRVFTGLILGALFVVLMALELFAEFGFLATQQESRISQANLASTPVKMAENNLLEAEGRITGIYSTYANINVDEVRSEMSAILENQAANKAGTNAGTIGGLTNDCTNTGTYYFKYCANYIELKNKLRGAESYHSAVADKTRLVREYNDVIKNTNNDDVGIGAAYVWAEEVSRLIFGSGIDAKYWQVITSLLMSALMVAWSAISGYLVMDMVDDDIRKYIGDGLHDNKHLPNKDSNLRYDVFDNGNMGVVTALDKSGDNISGIGFVRSCDVPQVTTNNQLGGMQTNGTQTNTTNNQKTGVFKYFGGIINRFKKPNNDSNINVVKSTDNTSNINIVDKNKNAVLVNNHITKSKPKNKKRGRPSGKIVGKIYQCSDCGQDYEAKTTWQKRCHVCADKIQNNYKKKKNIKQSKDLQKN